MFRHFSPKLVAACLALAWSFAGSASRADNSSELAPGEWRGRLVEIKKTAASTELSLTTNYEIGRATSPDFPVAEGQAFTFSAEVQTRFGGTAGSFYRVWLELEFCRGATVASSFASPLLTGSNEAPELLAITGIAPKGATSVRLSWCAQNKYWSAVANKATMTNPRLIRLTGSPSGPLEFDLVSPLPKEVRTRVARLVATADWPDGAAISFTTSLGSISASALIKDRRCEVTLRYPEKTVGSANLTATALGQTAAVKVADPLAGTLEIGQVLADGLDTAALVQVSKDRKMMPGRYQPSTPGIFIKPPWSIDLAPGTWQLRVLRGPEFRPFESEIVIESSESVAIESVRLARQVDPRTRHWYAGDADGDVYHGERIYTDVGPETAAQIAQAMGLDWVGVGSWGSPKPKTWGEANTYMRQLSSPNLLFMWTDEKPKTKDGHACFVGLERPDSDGFGWAWSKTRRTLRNHEWLALVRQSGGATFVNHPMRWWLSGEKFRTNMYSALPFDLCAAGLLDGLNVTEKPVDLMLWSMLLDRGYRVAATTGADFCLDRPVGPVPGKIRMYCYCPDGLSAESLARAVSKQNTIVSTGPILLSHIDDQPPGTLLATGKPYQISVSAWARGDQPDTLERVELWSHGKPIAAHKFARSSTEGEHTFTWHPTAEWDWVAVRLISKKGWALSSPFYAAGASWVPPKPVQSRVHLSVDGLKPPQREQAKVEIWDRAPDLPGAARLMERPLLQGDTLSAPVTATVIVRTGDGKTKSQSIFDAAGMPRVIEQISSGAGREKPLLDWSTYQNVLDLCAEVKMHLTF